uniref:Uncharacterized protein n=1 Tax=Pyxicephalus adspersus TaxID=30357 RepID=A0AAV3A6E8_PYXAD|nr:TPA: hypothetical protein GDO54_002945 [Pyxicephalus adspersus]
MDAFYNFDREGFRICLRTHVRLLSGLRFIQLHKNADLINCTEQYTILCHYLPFYYGNHVKCHSLVPQTFCRDWSIIRSLGIFYVSLFIGICHFEDFIFNNYFS